MFVYFLDVLNGIKKIKNNSEPKLNLSNNTKSNVTQSAIEIGRKTGNDPSSLITQVPQYDSKIDIKNLTNTEEIEDFFYYTEQCLLMIHKMKMPSLNEIEHLRIDLPKSLAGKKLAIFDLDETLIHCEYKDLTKAEKTINISLKDGKKIRVRYSNNIINFFVIIIIINVYIIDRIKYTTSHNKRITKHKKKLQYDYLHSLSTILC